MYVPPGLTEAVVVQTIQNVVRKIAKKYKFGYYVEEDLEQEALIIIIEQKILEKYYDETKPLENFLYVVLKTRLGNLKRDKYVRRDPPCVRCPLKAFLPPNGCSAYKDKEDCKFYKKWLISNASRKNIMHTINIDNVCDVEEPSMSYETDFLQNIDLEEVQSLLLENLDIKSRKYFIKMQNGIKVSTSELSYLTEKIKEVLDGKEEDSE